MALDAPMIVWAIVLFLGLCFTLCVIFAGASGITKHWHDGVHGKHHPEDFR